MFTGIVRAIGSIVASAGDDHARQLTIDISALATDSLAVGDSLCVAGVCLTAAGVEARRFTASLSSETLRCTTLGALVPGAAVNLEPALAAGDALGGHYVTGHVDGVARVESVEDEAGSARVSLAAPASLARYLALKGSVTVDGVSLTVNRLRDNVFDVCLVPHTRAVTTLGGLRTGAAVNLEVDVLARYLERLFGSQWRR
ncbi:MAG: riboflavin synthase [Gammaproteobacteria bacterium]|nr:riboflavin synthase [Gammaproteobacteria bacterium]